MKTSLFYLDGDERQLVAFRELFSNEYDVRAAASVEEARRELEECAADIIISDQRAAGVEGAEFLRLASRLCPEAFRVMVSAYVHAGSLLSEIGSGVVHCFVPKPWTYESMRQALERAELFARAEARPRRSAGERRAAPRRPVRLETRVLIMATGGDERSEEGVAGCETMHALGASTYDLSESGVALLVPAEEMATLESLGRTCLMRLVLGLPAGAVELTVRQVRQEWLGGREYLVGTEITDMTGRDRVLYMEYVRGLTGEQCSRPTAT
jgi:CheY-like chemotaxis protein